MSAAVAETTAGITPHLIGHDEAMQQVADALSSGRMHHAWLMAGVEGIGKMTLAMHIAASVLSGGENQIGKINLQHRVTKLIAAEAHPDMLVVRRGVDEKTGEQRKVITVDEVLKIANFLHNTSTHGGWRVVIIDEAHLLNRNGQNAVLKILEEPPSRTLILITVTTPGALLPTIRSRCRVLPLAPLDEKQMKTILRRTAPTLSEDDLARLVTLSGGSVGFALKVAGTEMLPLFEEIEGMLSPAKPLDLSRLHKIAEKISPKSEADSYEVMTTLLVNSLGQAARHEAVGQGSTPQLEQKMRLWEKVGASFTLADSANLDRKLAFINAVGDIRAAI